MRRPLLFCTLLTASFTACSDGGEDDPSEFFRGQSSAELGAGSNEATCATCHADGDTSARLSGDSLADIAFKTSWKGGGESSLLAAVNVCVTGWMAGAPLDESSSEWDLLGAYLESISSPSATTPNVIEPEVLANEAAYEAAYAGGDAGAGEALFTAACGGCHGSALVVGGTTAPSRAALAGVSVGRIAQQVRTSGPPPSGSEDPDDTTPGPMPFFEPAELSPEELADIIAFLRSGSS